MLRSLFAAGIAVSVSIWGAAAAHAQDAPPMPSPDDARRVVEQAPPTTTVQPEPIYRPAPMYYGPGPSTPCCFQRRDECGCALDACGNRYCPWMLTLEGGITSISSPDGILGERLFIPGHQLSWEDVDYPATFGGRGTLSYRYECLSRVELRVTYYGNPDEDNTDSGFFAARPGALGIGDVSRPVDATFDADAEMWSGELNWWTELMCSGRWRMDAGAGLRYVSFDENARV